MGGEAAFWTDEAWRERLAREYEFWYLEREAVVLLMLGGGRTAEMRGGAPIEPKPLHTIFLVP